MKFAGGAGNEQPTQPSRTLGSRPADAGGTGAAHAWIGAIEQLIVQVNRMARPTLATDEAEGLTLDHEIVHDHFKAARSPKARCDIRRAQ
jgi:hypothetical protein